MFATTEDDDDSLVEGFPGVPAVNPTRDALQEGILGLIRPTVETLDQKVIDTRNAQEELKRHIEALAKDLETIKVKTSKGLMRLKRN